MGRGVWWAAVHGVARSRTRLNDFPFTFHFHTLEKEMATHSSALAWRIPGTGEPGGLPSMGSHRVGHDWSNLAAAAVLDLFVEPMVSKKCYFIAFFFFHFLATSWEIWDVGSPTSKPLHPALKVPSFFLSYYFVHFFLIHFLKPFYFVLERWFRQ